MPQYERGHSGQEIGEMQQRLTDLGYEINVNYEFDEHTEEALRRYQVDWLYGDGTGVADEETLTQLEYHHSTHTSQSVEVQYSEQHTEQPSDPPVSEDGQHWWDGSQWIPFGNPQLTFGYGHTSDQTGEHYFVGVVDLNDSVTGTKDTILGGHLNVSDAGVQADAEVAKWDIETPFGVGVQAGALDAQAELVAGNQGYYGVGAQANIVEGSVSYGAQGDPHSTDDVFIKGGASYGVGAGARVYAGTDVDHDGVNEYGLGVDYEFLGGDVRVESETLTAVENAATAAYNEVKQEASDLVDGVVDEASKILSGEEPLPDVRN